MRRHRYNFGLGNRFLNIDFDFSFGKQKRWWDGPNVCYSTTTHDNKSADHISPHNELYSKKCDDTGTAYKCVSTVIKMMTEETTTEVRECCAGYTRKEEDYGCPIELNLKNIVETARDLELNQFIRATESVGLLSQLDQGNFTVFAPADEAFEDLDGVIQTDNNVQLQDMGSVVVVSRPLTELLVADLQNLLLGHLSFDTLTTSKINDEQLVETGSPFKSKIRINFYGNSEKLMTANCRKVKSRDNIATNGVIHVVEGLLEPVTKSILDIISKNPQLSYLKTALGRSGLGQIFREDGQFSFFAPTDNAFRQIDQRVLNRLLNSEKCLEKVLKNHVLPNVICSAVIQGTKYSTNLLNKNLRLERDEDDKLFVEGVQIIDIDVMGTNGVLYLIDEVLLSDDALGLLDIAQKENATKVLELIETAGLTKSFREAENITFFVPTDEAISELDPSVLTELQNDPEALRDVLKYHLSPSVQTCSDFYNDYQLDTLNDDNKLRINEYSSFPFSRGWTRTVQCAQITKASLKACNGVVHIVDKVLLPPKGKVIDILELDSRFTKLVELIKMSDLADVLERGELFTVFAPTNAAFEELDSDLLNDLENNMDELSAFLKNHVIKDALCCAGITESSYFGRSVRTMYGERHRVTVQGDIPIIDGKDIIGCDIMATNGIVHAIDEALVPERMKDAFGFGSDFWGDNFDWTF